LPKIFILQTNLLILNNTYFNCKFQIQPPALALSEMYHEEVARSDLHLKNMWLEESSLLRIYRLSWGDIFIGDPSWHRYLSVFVECQER